MEFVQAQGLIVEFLSETGFEPDQPTVTPCTAVIRRRSIHRNEERIFLSEGKDGGWSVIVRLKSDMLPRAFFESKKIDRYLNKRADELAHEAIAIVQGEDYIVLVGARKHRSTTFVELQELRTYLVVELSAILVEIAAKFGTEFIDGGQDV